jgi:hypothetical protein
MSEAPVSAEDRLDAVYRLTALLLLCVGVVHGTGALRDVAVNASLTAILASGIHKALLVVTPLLAVFTIWKSLALRRKAGPGCLHVKDGFIYHSIQRAVVLAGFITYLSLVMMHEFSDDTLLPVKFYLNLAMAIMTTTFGVTYLLSSRVKSDDDNMQSA